MPPECPMLAPSGSLMRKSFSSFLAGSPHPPGGDGDLFANEGSSPQEASVQVDMDPSLSAYIGASRRK